MKMRADRDLGDALFRLYPKPETKSKDMWFQ